MSDNKSKPSEAALRCADRLIAEGANWYLSDSENLARLIDEAMQHSAPSRPLPKGTRIEWDGLGAVVVHDAGGDLIEVIPDVSSGGSYLWHWRICGITCKVIQ